MSTSTPKPGNGARKASRLTMLDILVLYLALFLAQLSWPQVVWPLGRWHESGGGSSERVIGYMLVDWRLPRMQVRVRRGMWLNEG